MIYIVTGKDIYGKRFKLTYSNYIMTMGINLYNGSVWLEENGKRKLLKRVDN